jgi:hypothetical protein
MIVLLQRSRNRNRKGALPNRHLIYSRGTAFFTDVSYLITLHVSQRCTSVSNLYHFDGPIQSSPLSAVFGLPFISILCVCVEKIDEVGVDVFVPMFYIINVQFIYISVYILLFYIAKTT